MPILPFKNVEHVIYEHIKEAKLVAVEKEESKKRWALTDEERAANDEKYKRYFEYRKTAKGLW